jgi:hypothetical protein
MGKWWPHLSYSECTRHAKTARVDRNLFSQKDLQQEKCVESQSQASEVPSKVRREISI